MGPPPFLFSRGCSLCAFSSSFGVGGSIPPRCRRRSYRSALPFRINGACRDDDRHERTVPGTDRPHTSAFRESTTEASLPESRPSVRASSSLLPDPLSPAVAGAGRALEGGV